MASTNNFSFFFCFLLIFVLPCIAKTSFRPKALVLPVTKDAKNLQYFTYITHKTPLKPIKLFVDLRGHAPWVDCQRGYNSSTYKHVPCKFAQCKLAKSWFCEDPCSDPDPLPRCIKDTCLIKPYNPLIDEYLGNSNAVSEDVILIPSTDGSKLGQVATVKRFIFTCVPTWFAKSLPSGVAGFAALGRSRIALPSQLAQAFSFPRKFGLCLSSSTKSDGVIIFGDGPYVMQPNVDVSKNLIYTPLLINPEGVGAARYSKQLGADYYIGVRSIKINGKTVKINTTLLSIDKEGNGGTEISTTTPYSILETSIYNAVTEAFIQQLPINVTRLAAVKPFGLCISSESIASTLAGPAVPPIDLVLQSDNVFWRIFGANSMVQVNKSVLCLGILDGGLLYRTVPIASIVIGAHQIEDNLLQFDLAKSKLGFSSSLLFRQTTCANFNFTFHA